MSDSYPERVRDTLLPLSHARTLREAFREWGFNGATVDHEEPRETCQLCGQDQLRYHFEISNSTTGSTLWVGSQCILRFGVAVVEGGEALSPSRAKRKLESLVSEMRRRSCLRALECLAGAEDSDILASALKFYGERGYLTPKFAFVVFWRLNRNNIDHSPSFFKVSLRRDTYKADLRSMETSRVHLIWPALSSSQRKIAERVGHEPPSA